MKASGHYIRKRLRTAGLARRLAAFALLFLVVGILVYRFGGVDFEAMKAILAVAFGLAAAALLIALAGLARVWRSGHEGGGTAVGALALSLAVLAPFALGAVLAFDSPPVSEAATDGMLAADIVSGAPTAPASSAGEGAGGEGAPVISGRRFQATAAQVYAVAKLVLADVGWSVSRVAASAPPEDETSRDLGISGTVDIAVPTPRASLGPEAGADPLDQPDSDDYTIEAAAAGPVFALPSDVTIRIVEDGPETFVDLRSASRVAAWDLGQNRRFIEDFLVRLDEAMAGVLTVVPAAQG